MTTTITKGTTTIANPVLWMDYQAVRAVGTQAHSLMNGEQVIIHRPAARRVVEMRLLFDSETAAKACADAHAVGGIFRIVEAGRTTLTMRYVVVGQIVVQLDPETADVWIVTIGAQEVP